jgi:hypothetical protein
MEKPLSESIAKARQFFLTFPNPELAVPRSRLKFRPEFSSPRRMSRKKPTSGLHETAIAGARLISAISLEVLNFSFFGYIAFQRILNS